MGAVASGDGRPTQQAGEVFTLLSRRLDEELARLRTALAPLAAVNEIVRGAGLEPIEAKTVEVPQPVPAPNVAADDDVEGEW